MRGRCVQGHVGEDRICEQEHQGLHRRACEQGRCGHGVRRRWHAGELRKARAENLVLIRRCHALGGISGSRSVRIHFFYVFSKIRLFVPHSEQQFPQVDKGGAFCWRATAAPRPAVRDTADRHLHEHPQHRTCLYSY
jgi:hypothetical protein